MSSTSKNVYIHDHVLGYSSDKQDGPGLMESHQNKINTSFKVFAAEYVWANQSHKLLFDIEFSDKFHGKLCMSVIKVTGERRRD